MQHIHHRKQERAPYHGTEVGLVISIDLGTSFSSSAWAILEPQQIPHIFDVSGYAGQEFQTASTQVPTVVYYDSLGNMKAAGSKIHAPEIVLEAEERSWARVEWFKLLLQPHSQGDNVPRPQLPPGKSAIDVIGDFLGYMSGSALEHFRQQVGQDLYSKVKNNRIYVLSWNTFQLDRMKRAMVLGKLIADTDNGRSKVILVSEAEASIHWCVANGVCRNILQVQTDKQIILVNAGTGTIDVSSYEVLEGSPLKLKEIKAPQSCLAGSIFVTRAFEIFVRSKLEASTYGNEETIQILINAFDKTAISVFRRKDRRLSVPFGSSLDNEPEFDIESGRLLIQGSDMADFLEQSCAAAADTIRSQILSTSYTTVCLVGCFAASPWLFQEIQNRLKDCKIEVCRAETLTESLVSNGLLCYYLNRQASGPFATWTYGIYVNPLYCDDNTDHIQRQDAVYENPITGKTHVSGGFHPLILKGSPFQENLTARWSLDEYEPTRSKFEVNHDLVCYIGERYDIKWVDEDPINFKTICSFKAEIPVEALVQEGRIWPICSEDTYWRLSYDAVVSFRSAGFVCYVEWKDQEGTKYCGEAVPVSFGNQSCSDS